MHFRLEASTDMKIQAIFNSKSQLDKNQLWKTKLAWNDLRESICYLSPILSCGLYYSEIQNLSVSFCFQRSCGKIHANIIKYDDDALIPSAPVYQSSDWKYHIARKRNSWVDIKCTSNYVLLPFRRKAEFSYKKYIDVSDKIPLKHLWGATVHSLFAKYEFRTSDCHHCRPSPNKAIL